MIPSSMTHLTYSLRIFPPSLSSVRFRGFSYLSESLESKFLAHASSMRIIKLFDSSGKTYYITSFFISGCHRYVLLILLFR